MTGRFSRAQKGYGFITPQDETDDLYVPEGGGKGAMTGDTVEYRATFESADGRRRQAEVTRVTDRASTRAVGEYRGAYIIEDRTTNRLRVQKGGSLGAADGHKVVAEITKYPRFDGDEPWVRVSKVIGHKNDPGADVLSVVERLEIPHTFPDDVLQAAQAAPAEVTDKDMANRRDLRDKLIITIDGADAKDLDDAVSLERTETGWRLGVHIADVSHYVRPNTPLIREAYERGTSVYLADRVIPMLPHRLSNGICSLNPEQPRLTLSCVMEVDKDGKVTASDVFESVIKSRRRMTYEDVNEMITNPSSPLRNHYGDVTQMLDDMNELRAALYKRRLERGAMDFASMECKIEVDESGAPTVIKPYPRNDATNLIEEFMLLCNETIAERFFWAGSPFVYRTHEPPNNAKIIELGIFTARFGHTIRVKSFQRDAKAAIEAAKGRPEEMIINRVILRSLKQARYTADPKGHFGLAAKYYCHFTSPIRRFPDLQIHQIIKDSLAGKTTAAGIDALNARLPEICARCSTTERRAEQAEREVESMKKAEFMMDKIGQYYSGIVSGVTDFGVFVELADTIEGMIPIHSLGRGRAGFQYSAETMSLVSRHTRRVIKLGDRLRVRVEAADKFTGKVTFGVAER